MTPKENLRDDLFVFYAKEIEEILYRAGQHAALMHKRAGNPIAIWKDGQIVIILPEEIPVEDPLHPESKQNDKR